MSDHVEKLCIKIHEQTSTIKNLQLENDSLKRDNERFNHEAGFYHQQQKVLKKKIEILEADNARDNNDYNAVIGELKEVEEHNTALQKIKFRITEEVIKLRDELTSLKENQRNSDVDNVKMLSFIREIDAMHNHMGPLAEQIVRLLQPISDAYHKVGVKYPWNK